MVISSGVRIAFHFFIYAILLRQCRAQNGSAATAASSGNANSECVKLGLDADGFLEKIDPKSLLFLDAQQKSYLQQACENYKKMRAQTGCVPQQQVSIYDYACDTVYELARTQANAECWNRTSACSLVKLLPSTDSITAAYCKFLTSAGVQLGCALELAPPCENPSNAAMSQAVVKGRSLLDSFQCAVLTPTLSVITGSPNEARSTHPVLNAATAAGAADQNSVITSPLLSPNQPILQLGKATEAPLVLTSTLPNCDLGQNAKALICASNLLGVQDKFSDTSGSLILQELAKNSSTELREVCQKFIAYQDCMTQQTFQAGAKPCLTKSRIHDFASSFFTFCDPANQPRVQRSHPCVAKLVDNSDQRRATAFQQCRQNLMNMRANVKLVLQQNQDALALCRGLLFAEAFFDCVKPIVASACSKDNSDDMAYFRQRVADQIGLVGCPLNDPRLSNFTEAASAATNASPAFTSSTTQQPTSGPELLVKAATVSIIETDNRASTMPVDETVPLLHVNSNGYPCSAEDIRLFSICYENITGIDFHPMTILKKPDHADAICEAFERYHDCLNPLDCYPPGGDGLDDMLGLFCENDAAEFKKNRTCMEKAADTPAGISCANGALPKNFLNMENDEICNWANTVVNCSYGTLQSKCDMDTADYVFKIWQGFAKGVNRSCVVEMPTSGSNETVIGVPVMCTASEESVVDRCMQPFTVITDQLASVVEGGLQAFMRGMRRITEIFKSGCDARIGFDECMLKSITKGSQCHVSSCLIKVTEYACNFSGDSDMTLENRLKCMWSMIGEPEFGKCMKLLPKNAFQNINRLKRFLPRFVNCLEAPMLRKCGQTTVTLVKALSSQPSSDPNDTTCVVDVHGSNANNATIPPALSRVTTSEATLSPRVAGASTASTWSIKAAALPTSKPTGTTEAASKDERPVCSKASENMEVAKCHMALAEGGYEPLPVKIFNSLSDLDPACNAYKNFSTCARSLPCRSDFTAAVQEMLLRVCTLRYNDYKHSANCLISVANSPNGIKCITPVLRLNLTEPQTDGGRAACQTINSMIACITPDLTNKCDPQAVDLVYATHVAFAKNFKSDCVIKAPNTLVGGTDCTQDELDAFESCMKKPNNYSLNPVSMIASPEYWNDFCTTISSDFQRCLENLTCSPKPFGAAFNDTWSFACASPDFRAKYEKYESCLGAVVNTATGRDCLQPYKDIQWYGGDFPQNNAGKICKSINSSLSCAAPEISQRCEQEALKLVYDINQRLVSQIQPECLLAVPVDLPAKLNLTTTETPAAIKTTPPKAKEETTASRASFGSINGKLIMGSIFLYALIR